MTMSSDRFWEQTEAVLSEFPMDVRLDRDDFYSQSDWDVFRMHYTSADGYRLFAWLSAPHGVMDLFQRWSVCPTTVASMTSFTPHFGNERL